MQPGTPIDMHNASVAFWWQEMRCQQNVVLIEFIAEYTKFDSP